MGVLPAEVEAPDLPDERGPERTCIVTRTNGGKDALIRFVVSPDGTVVPDIWARLPGRGAWVSADATTVALAVKKKAFARAFKAAVTTPADLPAIVDRLIEADALQALSIANKAGLVVCGAMKVETAIANRPIVGLIHATAAGDDGIRKMSAAVRRRFGEEAGSIQRVLLFTSGQLDLALGRTHVIHAATAAGAASMGFLARARRLEHYRGLEPPSVVSNRATGDSRETESKSQEDGDFGGAEINGLGPRDG